MSPHAPCAGQSRGWSAARGLSCWASWANLPETDPWGRTGKLSSLEDDRHRFFNKELTLSSGPNCRADVRGGAHLPVLPGFSLAAEEAGPHALPAGSAQGTSPSQGCLNATQAISFIVSFRTRNHPEACESSHTWPVWAEVDFSFVWLRRRTRVLCCSILRLSQPSRPSPLLCVNTAQFASSI